MGNNKDDSNINMTNLSKNQSIEEPLLANQLDNENEKSKGWKYYKESNCQKIKRVIFGPSKQKVKRKVKLNGTVEPKNHQKNIIVNTKYTILTFIPIILFNQFKLFFNTFFLLITLSQLIPALKVGYAFTYYTPLVFVLVMNMGKELYDDMKRYYRDKQANAEEFKKLTPKGLETIKSSEIKTGDIIEISKGQRVPADCVILHNDSPNGAIFVKTDQLDGETDWKLRKAAKITQNYVNSFDPIKGMDIVTFEDDESRWSEQSQQEEEQLLMNNSESPNKFNNNLSNHKYNNNSSAKSPLGSSSLKVANLTTSNLKNQSKLQKSKLHKSSMAKRSLVQYHVDDVNKPKLLGINCYLKVDKPIENIYEFNGLIKAKNKQGVSKTESLSLENTVWANMYISSGTLLGVVIYSGKETRMEMNSREPRTKLGQVDYQLSFLSKILFWLLLFLTVAVMFLRPPTPLSVQWATDFMRYFILLSQLMPISLRVNVDFAKLYYSICINIDKQIPGTIARNSSIPEELGRIEYLLSDKTGTLTQNDMIFKRLSLEKVSYTSEDVQEIQDILHGEFEKSTEPIPDSDKLVEAQGRGRKFDRQNNIILKDLILALALCHNVTPTENDDGEKEYQASSPDEIALVQLAEELGVKLESRDISYITIQNMVNKKEDYEILKIFPFSSETKRMGIILRHLKSKKIIFYMKGADVVMKQFISENKRGYIDEECEELAREGLRTLVITQKLIQENEYKKWAQEYKLAEESLDNRVEKVNSVIQKLEKNMEFLGITGVEDKLQENVCQVVEDMREAGMKVWMLTGDKIETAICISISSGLKASTLDVFQLKEIEDEVELQHKLNEYSSNRYKTSILVIDGISLKAALENQEKLFFTASTKAPAVVCCRCSPTQKATLTEKIKKYTKKIVCAIGDGGNDVGMIQQANVGVGIVGKEGKQAALAADYSIHKFEYLRKLLLYHGRHSYKRTALLSQFVLHRGLIITVMQMVFTCCYYFVSLPIFNSILMIGYSTVFTMLPVFCLVFDEDVDSETAIRYPPLYKSLLRGRELSIKTFLGWVARAVYTGSMIILMSMLLFKNSFLVLESLSFSILIFIEYIMTLSELNFMHLYPLLTAGISMVIYFIIWFGCPQIFEIQRVDDIGEFGLLVIVTIASYFPILVVQLIRKIKYPTDYETIVKTSNKNKKLMDTKIFSS